MLPFVSRKEFDRVTEDLRQMRERVEMMRRDIIRLDLFAADDGSDWVPRFLTRPRDVA